MATWRKLRRLIITEVADRADASPHTLMRLEAGRGSTLEKSLRVAWALGVLDLLVPALYSYATDVGRARASEVLPTRVRRRAEP